MTQTNYFKNRKAALGTKHSKEIVISPVLESKFGMKVEIPKELDTDKFGTFSGEVARKNSQKDTAKLKATEAMNLLKTEIGIGSEGSFSEHPDYHGLILNTEIVAFIDTKLELEIYGVSTEIIDYAKVREIKNLDELIEFTNSIDFPKHSVVLKKSETNYTNMSKGINNIADLTSIAKEMLNKEKSIWIETDLRAHMNEERMQNIKKATLNLVEILERHCPSCDKPGLEIVGYVKGLPCELCARPTNLTLSETYRCNSCGFEKEQMYPNGNKSAYSGSCDFCNP